MVDTLLAATPIVALVVAVSSVYCAFLSYRLSKKIQDDLRSDEKIIVGPVLHPSLQNWEHNNCVVVCTLFNKSHRKAYVHSVRARDQDGEGINISWSSSIDQDGNPEQPFELVGLIDSVNLYVRRDDDEMIYYMALEIRHSFPNSPVTVVFDLVSDWD